MAALARRLVASIALLASLLVAAIAWAAFTPPPIEGHITDRADLLSPEERAALEAKLEQVRVDSNEEIAVLVIPSLEGETIEDVAYATFNTWKLGQRGADNGVLLVIAPAERRVRIETGKGVGGALTDLQSSDIIREVIAPALAQGRFYDAVDEGTTAIARALGSEPAAPRRRPRASPVVNLLSLLLPFLIFLVLFRARRRHFRGTGGWGPGGWGGGWGGRGG